MPDRTRETFLEKTLKNLRMLWQGIAGVEYDEAAASLRPDLPDEDLARVRRQMLTCLETKGGEVTARARAAALGRAYLSLDAEGRERFLRLLADEFASDRNAIDAAVADVTAANDPDDRRAAERRLREVLVAPRVKLFTQFNDLPEGVKFLVDMRAELMPLARRDPTLQALELDLRNLLTMWFDVGFLELRRITWEHSPAALLEKLIAYEAVHAIRSWEDMKNRLAPDRRCFGYFHSRMPDEPLIFVEVALVQGMAGNIATLLDETAPLVDPARADSAIFYSITSAQSGLAGISFGNFLIKRVVDNLSAEFKNLKTFATLSPIPGFRIWLENRLAKDGGEAFTTTERKALAEALRGEPDFLQMVSEIATGVAWINDDRLEMALKAPLMRLCAHYLLSEKRGSDKALDPVAHFHLSNGARMERLNWMANRSQRGTDESLGMMINYAYRLGEIDDNHEAYTTAGKVAASTQLRGLAK